MLPPMKGCLCNLTFLEVISKKESTRKVKVVDEEGDEVGESARHDYSLVILDSV